MSYRDRNRLSGYRSQPVSNRTSLYLSSDFNVGVSEDYSDFDRQFKKLLERTETFTNRVERLQNTSSYLKKGFRGVDTTLSRLRNQRDVIGSSYGNIETRLFGEDQDPTTEEEWKRLLDAGTLLEKAVELVRQRYRYPKPVFEYSPESRSPAEYNVPAGTVLLPNPRSPRDKEGKRIRDLGSEIKDHDTKPIFANTNGHRPEKPERPDRTDRTAPCAKRLKKIDTEKSKSLTSLKEIDEKAEEADVLVEKPSLRARLANQKSKDEQKPDTESTSTTQTTRTGLSTEERRQSTKSLYDTARTTTSTIDSSTTHSTRTGLPTEERRNSTKSLYDTGRTTTSTIDSPRYSSRFGRDARKTTTTDDTPATDTYSSLRSSNLTGSTHSLYTTTERYKTRSERLKDLSTDKSSPTERPRSAAFRSESLFAERKSTIVEDTTTQDDDDDKSARRPSFLKTLKNAASRNKKRPTSMFDEINKTEHEKTEPKKSFLSPGVDDDSSLRRKSPDHLIYTNAELIRMAQADLEKGKKKKIEESVTPTLKKKPTSSSSSFHEYNPEKRVPLKDRLKNKMSETSTSTSDDDKLGITPLAQRASRFTRDKSTDKDDSLRSRFLRRFRLGSDEKGDEKKETLTERRNRKKAESQDDDSTSRGHGKASDTGEKDETDKSDENQSKTTKYDLTESANASKYDTYTTRGMKLSVDHRLTTIDIEMENIHNTGRSLSEILKKEEEIIGADMSKYSAHSYRSRQRLKEAAEVKSPRHERQKSSDSDHEKQKASGTRSSHYNRQKSSDSTKEDKLSPRLSKKKALDDDDAASKSDRRSRRKDKEETKKEEAKKEPVVDNKSVMSIRERREREKDTLKEPITEFVRDDIPSPKGVLRRLNPVYAFDKQKEKDSKKDVKKLDSLDRKSLFINEEEIKPVLKDEEVKVDFKSPRASIVEVTEEIVMTSRTDRTIEDDFFKVLLQREVSEEDINIIGTQEKESNAIDNLFEKMNQFSSFDSKRTSSTSSEVFSERPSSQISISEQQFRSDVTSTDDLSEHNDVFENGKRSSSSADIFAKIEKANNKLYSGLLNLTSKAKDEGNEVDSTVQDSSDGGGGDGKKDETKHTGIVNDSITQDATDNVNTDASNLAIVDEPVVTDGISESAPTINGEAAAETTTDVAKSDTVSEVPVTQERKIEEISEIVAEPEEISENLSAVISPEEKFDLAPFKLMIAKKYSSEGPGSAKEDVSGSEKPKEKSFDTVNEATEDVNKMLSNCDSIDKINDDIQRSHPSVTNHGDNKVLGGSKSTENLGGSQSTQVLGGSKSADDLSIVENDRSKSPNRKRSSYLAKRNSHLKFFQSDLSVSNEDIQNLSDSGSGRSSKESIGNTQSIVEQDEVQTKDDESDRVKTDDSVEKKEQEEEEVVKNGKEVDSTEESNISSEESTILNNLIDSVEENIKNLKRKNSEEEKSDETINVIEAENKNKIIEENKDEKTNTNGTKIFIQREANKLTSSKSLEEHDDKSTDMIKISNKAKMAAMRSVQSVDIKSLDEIRSRLDEIKNNSVTSSLVNVSVTMDTKPANELKSLDEIKNRLNQIKARKKELKLLEINKNAPDKESASTSQNGKTNEPLGSGSESEKLKTDDDDCATDIVMSPIRKIKLSNDFLEEPDESEEPGVGNGDVFENGAFHDDTTEKPTDSSDKIKTNGQHKEENASTTVNGDVGNGDVAHGVLHDDEKDVKESVEALLNKVLAANGNEKARLEIKESLEFLLNKVAEANGNEKPGLEIKESVEDLLNKVAEANGNGKPRLEIQESVEVLLNKVAEANGNEKPRLEVTHENRKQTEELKINDNNKEINITGNNDCKIAEGKTDVAQEKKTERPVSLKSEDDAPVVYLNGHKNNDTKDSLKVSAKKSGTSSPSHTNEDAISSSTEFTDSHSTSKMKGRSSSADGTTRKSKTARLPVPRQMSIVEYRRKKLEQSGSESIFASDDENENPILKSDNDNLKDKDQKSSVADVSDASDDCRKRRKYYRHSKKDIKSVADGVFSTSGSEDSGDEDVSLVDRLTNRYIQRTRIGSHPALIKSPTSDTTEMSSHSAEPSSRNKSFSQKIPERYKENGNV